MIKVLSNAKPFNHYPWKGLATETQKLSPAKPAFNTVYENHIMYLLYVSYANEHTWVIWPNIFE